MSLADIFLLFILYSFAGWLWETLLIIVRDHKFVNRGFLYGPLCPIYGFGAVFCSLLLFGRIDNIALLFIIGAVIGSTIEYTTHWTLEKLFHAKWWDYSDMKFNLHGRTNLLFALLFGACIVVIIDFLHPFLLSRLALSSPMLLNLLAFILYTIFVADITLTMAGLVGLKGRLESLQETLTEQMQKGIDLTEEKRLALMEMIESSQIYGERLQKLTLSSFTSRFLVNFPELKSERYKDALERVKQKMGRK